MSILTFFANRKHIDRCASTEYAIYYDLFWLTLPSYVYVVCFVYAGLTLLFITNAFRSFFAFFSVSQIISVVSLIFGSK